MSPQDEAIATLLPPELIARLHAILHVYDQPTLTVPILTVQAVEDFADAEERCWEQWKETNLAETGS